MKMSETVKKEKIHAKGFDISIYTTDFQNEFISLTDIARYKSDDPTAVIQNCSYTKLDERTRCNRISWIVGVAA